MTLPTAQHLNDHGVGLAHVSFGYPNGPSILRDFSHCFPAGITVIKGPSGSGKTTLLRLLAGFLRPQSGKVNCPIRPVLVLQEDSLIPWLTAKNNIQFFTRKSDDQIAKHELLSTISPFMSDRVCRMSYGQRRLVELFRALLHAPEVLLLDEPFNFIDDARVVTLIESIKAHASTGATIIVTTHRHDRSLDRIATVCTLHGTAPYSTFNTRIPGDP